ncbi:unnamed protein product [Prunus armeniaca]|uniref:Uncharacterized protein n=1 Tax=Prunus armeniaca TaxID=36596 RepID=A0A6J5WMP3_PRUAR|nr:unnamed protein product [Prunus armeniaca]CAB4302849.1 unnamed protein product [Prunus armeniaca]
MQLAAASLLQSFKSKQQRHLPKFPLIIYWNFGASVHVNRDMILNPLRDTRVWFRLQLLG